jgi:uncharacterized damage-inducible protein DinB
MKAETLMTRIVDPILTEMDQEAEITKRLLDIIPEDKLSWRPHPKAKSLGELAMHVATVQGSVAEIGQQDKEAGDFPPDIQPRNRSEILDAFAQSLTKAKEIVFSTDDAAATAEWQLTKNGSTILAMPRLSFWRSILLNHYYHHRGQLSAYLRQLDVPLPSIYGPSADTDPFA